MWGDRKLITENEEDYIECRFVRPHSKARKQNLHKFWDLMSEEERYEILETSGIVDVLADNLKELGDYFSTLTKAKWADLPGIVKLFLKRGYFVEGTR